MKTVIDKDSGKILFITAIDVEPQENQMIVNGASDFVKGYYNFETQTFYETAIPEEIALNNKALVPEKITAMQFFKKLLINGITKALILTTAEQMLNDNYIDQFQYDLIELFLTNATIIERKAYEMDLFKSAFNLTNEQLDQLFIEADQL